MADAALIILLHGIGGSGSSLLPIATAWRSTMANVRIVAPDAPFPYAHGSGHQWFGIDGRELRPDRIASVRRSFDHLVNDILQRESFADRLDRVAFVGISQGAIVALDAVASGRWSPKALVSIAGMLPPIAVVPTASSTRVMLLHGAVDQTVPAAAARDAAGRLASIGFSVESHIKPGLGHTVSAEQLELARKFLIKAFDI